MVPTTHALRHPHASAACVGGNRAAASGGRHGRVGGHSAGDGAAGRRAATVGGLPGAVGLGVVGEEASWSDRETSTAFEKSPIPKPRVRLRTLITAGGSRRMSAVPQRTMQAKSSQTKTINPPTRTSRRGTWRAQRLTIRVRVRGNPTPDDDDQVATLGEIRTRCNCNGLAVTQADERGRPDGSEPARGTRD